jgi:predicted HTH domain antitoxin
MVVHLQIPEGVAERAGLDERTLRIELACTLFAQRKLALWPAAQMAGLSRGEMEDELAERNIPIYYVDQEYWEQEKEALRQMEKEWPSSSATPPQ